jgi:predicted pyridoxine 5'-phosphate oxidase superfamily flavin-nucleotide-binding protein
MPKQYTDTQLALQREFESEALAARLASSIVRTEFTDSDAAFITAQDMFFLATVDDSGQPTCSYKGGEPGFVRVVSSQTLRFPLYDGNGMFLSAGNVQATSKVGLLFISFEVPHRLRIDGMASLSRTNEDLAEYPGALLVASIAATAIYVNCPRYIHRHRRVAPSKYVPKPGKPQPLPQWKRLELFTDVLSSEESERVREAGGTLPLESYRALLAKGEA